MDDLQPGQVIVPHAADEPQQPAGAPPEPVHPPALPDDKPRPVPQPGPAPDPSAAAGAPFPQAAATSVAVPNQSAAPVTEPEQDAGWQYQQSAGVAQPPALPEDGITWTSSEFIAHEKGAEWYGLLLLGGLAAAAADYLLLKDKISAVIIVLAAVAFAVLSAHKPRTQQYALTTQGLQIGAKAYFFHDFKNFSVAEEGAISSIVFMPLKRFMPPLTIYVSPEMQDQVMEFLSAILPFEQHRADAVDSLMRRIRF